MMDTVLGWYMSHCRYHREQQVPPSGALAEASMWQRRLHSSTVEKIGRRMVSLVHCQNCVIDEHKSMLLIA